MTNKERNWRKYEALKPDPTLPNPMLSVLEAIEKNHPELLQKTTDDLADIIEQCDNEPPLVEACPYPDHHELTALMSMTEGVTVSSLPIDQGNWAVCDGTTPLLSKALRAICFMRDYCPDNMPAIKGWEWFDVGSEIAEAIPDDEWAIEFRNRVAIDQQHREIKDSLVDWLNSADRAPLATPIADVTTPFLDSMGFKPSEIHFLTKFKAIRITDRILDDSDQAKAFEEHEVEG